MLITILQFKPRLGAIKDNAHRILELCQAAALAADASRDRPHLVITPELALTGAMAMDLFEHQELEASCAAAIASLSDKLPSHTQLLLGAPWPSSAGRPHNAALHITQGAGPTLVSAKRRLVDHGLFDESRYFQPWTGPDSTLEIGGKRLALSIGDDLQRAANEDRPADSEAAESPPAASPDLSVNMAASMFQVGGRLARYSEIARVAQKANTPTLFVNQTGCYDSAIFDGGSMLIAADGALSYAASSFGEQAVTFSFDASSAPPVLSAELGATTEAAQPELPALDRFSPLRAPAPYEELHRALCEGIADYVRGSGFERVLVSLSGGLDSALVATLAADALGPSKVRCVAMPSPYSSQHGIEDATALAKQLGVELDCIQIDDAMAAVDKSLADSVGEPSKGLAHENMQARLRGLLLMTISNQTGALVLNASNKSELAIGYTTLYGDMCGALSPIADLYKTQVYGLAAHINASTERIPARILIKPPSAELREDQLDEDSLPPYDILDPILEEYIELGASRRELLARGHDPAAVELAVGRITRQEFKRVQAPPILKVSKRALGRGWRRPLTGAHPDR